MFQGYYDLASNMLTQQRCLNVISNNISNVSTPGYKEDLLVQSTFREELIYRYDKEGKTEVGEVSRMNIADERITNYSEGGLRETGNVLDVGLTGSGFFAVQGDNGTVYTRNGSFSLDDENYLVLQGVGRVLGTDGSPIQLPTDDVLIDSYGNIMSADGSQYYGSLQIVDFADYSQLTKITGGVFQSAAEPQASDAEVTQYYTEYSNVNVVDQMTQMISDQRLLQSSAQIFSIYDTLIGKIVNLGSAT